jgi:putative nucleotidyltransferase with HDIG domain
MLKRISVDHLRLGMYIQEFCGSWMDHPFWRTAFLLDSEKDLSTIHSTGIRELWIDTSKGLDVETGEAAEEVSQDIDIVLTQTAQQTTPQPSIQTDLDKEAARAIKICAESRRAVQSMFHEARMGRALDAADALPIVEEISSSVMRNPDALISLARLKNKDNYTYMHSVAVCALMVALSRRLGLNDEETRQAGLAGLLHDIGKMMMPGDVINKPGRLTDGEFATMRTHPEEGYKLLQTGSGISDIALDVCLHHHEKVDGSGYPHKLSGEQISLFAKMGAVCDVYDAITSDRAYKKGWEPAEAIRKMAEWRTGHFEQRIFEAFVRSVGIYPIGSLVKLESDRLGVVIEQTEQSLLTPKIKVFFSITSNCRITPEVLDLSQPNCHDKIVAHEDPAKWHIADMQQLWSGLPITA